MFDMKISNFGSLFNLIAHSHFQAIELVCWNYSLVFYKLLQILNFKIFLPNYILVLGNLFL
jgi:hypothetical protein